MGHSCCGHGHQGFGRQLRHLPVIDACAKTLAIRVPAGLCGCDGHPGEIPTDQLWIRRIGACGWMCSYPVFDVLADGTLDIRLDKNFFIAKPGLYEMVFGSVDQCCHDSCCCAWPFHKYPVHPNEHDHIWRHPFGDHYADGTVHSFCAHNSHRCHPRAHHGYTQGLGMGFWYGHLLGHQEYLDHPEGVVAGHCGTDVIHHKHCNHTHTHTYYADHCYPLNHQHPHNRGMSFFGRQPWREYGHDQDCCYMPPVAYLRLRESKPNWAAATTLMLDPRDERCATPAPEERDPMFDHLIDFCAPITSELPKCDELIHLSAEDASVLCNNTICRSVELELYDGVNTETVTFAGCENGVAKVTRGSPAYKFPKGALLRFRWTSANVIATQEGC